MYKYALTQKVNNKKYIYAILETSKDACIASVKAVLEVLTEYNLNDYKLEYYSEVINQKMYKGIAKDCITYSINDFQFDELEKTNDYNRALNFVNQCLKMGMSKEKIKTEFPDYNYILEEIK